MSTRTTKFTFFLFLNGILLFIISGCNTTQYLKENESFLAKNKIEIDKEQAQLLKNKTSLEYELSTLVAQNPNRRFLGIVPRRWYYYKANQLDSTWIRRFYEKRLAEEPSIFDIEKLETTEKNMTFFLNHKGYFKAKVEAEVKTAEHHTRVVYHIKPNELYEIDTLNILSEQPNIQRILNDTKANTFLKKGEPVDVKLYKLEMSRITRELRNHGFAAIYSNNISTLEGDSTGNKVNITLKVLPPFEGKYHKTYSIGKIRVFPDYDPTTADAAYDTIAFDDLIFFQKNGNDNIKLKVVADAIFFKKGDLFSQQKQDKTNRSLTSLGVFKFVSIKQENRDTIIDFNIYLTQKEHYNTGINLDINNTNRTEGDVKKNNFLGLSINPYLKNRNTFGGSELLNTNLSLGGEFGFGQSDSTKTLYSSEIGIQNSLYFPRFLDYFGVWKTISKFKKENVLYDLLREEAITSVLLGFKYVDIYNYTKYIFFNASYGFDTKISGTRRYSINHIGLDYFNPRPYKDFQKIIDENEYLKKSFGKQLFTGIVFRKFGYNYTGRQNAFGKAYYFGIDLEQSGSEVWLTNLIYDRFSKNPHKFKLGDIDFEQYLRIDLDGRMHHQYTRIFSTATRLYTGIAIPFGYSDKVPYVKQFYSGGPQSIRAWDVRELGPGGFVDKDSTTLFYQTGDLKLEFNTELRFHLFRPFGYFDVNFALFLDAGNVWTLDKDPDRLGSQFLTKPEYDETGEILNEYFVKQIAIGTGFGVRMDFSYLLFRLDVGLPVRTPYPDPNRNNKYWRNPASWSWKEGDLNLNFGLGYPF